ncbi:MAG: glycosyltransferase family 2 protein [Alphaproteobacteria bacterium]|nr:glycosyltransferase family 2 protein [Alphaproteobacteria bacterium]
MIHSQDLELTVIVPTRDRPQLFAAAVQSVLASLPECAEVLVVDNRSVLPVASWAADLDPRLRVTTSEAESGAAGARNWGVAHARGRRILFLDDDDLMMPGYPTWVLEQQSDNGFAPTLSFRGMTAPSIGAYLGGPGKAVVDVRPFRRQIAGLGCGFWIDRAAFLTVGEIAEDIRVNEDTEFSIRLLRAGLRGLRAPAPAVMVRQHDGLGRERGHLTAAAKAGERAGFFGMIVSRHADWLTQRPDAAKHLLQRQLKTAGAGARRSGCAGGFVHAAGSTTSAVAAVLLLGRVDFVSAQAPLASASSRLAQTRPTVASSSP